MTKTILHVEASIEPWKMSAPLKISGYTFDMIQLVTVSVSDGVRAGRGEAAGVYYRADAPPRMVRQIRQLGDHVGDGLSRTALLELLPPGGARNALDCALWELESLQRQIPIWTLAGLPRPKALVTTMTLGAAAPSAMAMQAKNAFPDALALKVKLLGDGLDNDRVTAVRAARPDVWLGVDANQGFTSKSLARAIPSFVAAGVSLIEQPFKMGEEALLDDLESPIPIAADESAQSIDDLEKLQGRVQCVNIKLDKCGGLTAAIMMVRRARELGFQVMVGTMPGTSLGVAPAFLVGQLCDIVDLDAPLFLSNDRAKPVNYAGGKVDLPSGLWGWGP